MTASPSVRTLGSKWIKTKVLQRSKELNAYVPETRLYNEDSFRQLLDRYKLVYVKPVHGSFGQGVIRVEKSTSNGQTEYTYQLDTTRRSFPTFHTLHQAVNRVKLCKAYLVQQGIPLLTYQDSKFDVRVMVQRTPSKPWTATGVVGRLAHPKKAVTNFHSQGKPLPLSTLLDPYMKGANSCADYERYLERLGVRIARYMAEAYPGFRELGVDIGIDDKLHPWVLEVNTAPDPLIFRHLKDKRMYTNVMSYARVNGRFLR